MKKVCSVHSLYIFTIYVSHITQVAGETILMKNTFFHFFNRVEQKHCKQNDQLPFLQ